MRSSYNARFKLNAATVSMLATPLNLNLALYNGRMTLYGESFCWTSMSKMHSLQLKKQSLYVMYLLQITAFQFCLLVDSFAGN